MPGLTVNVVRALFIASVLSTSCACAEGIDNPCAGPEAFLNIVGRPGNTLSACAMPYKKMDVESGYKYQQLYSPKGKQQNFPEVEFRIGLPASNEIFIYPPNYITQSISPGSGYTQTSTGFTHQFALTGKWLTALSVTLNLNDGDAGYGNKDLGITINAIASSSLTSKIGLTMMLGGSSLTTSSLLGGQRFTSINPDLLVSYTVSTTVSIFGEVYGQSSTGPGLGAGFNSDAGILFLLRPNVIVDLNIGQRLGGFPGNFERFVGAGLSVMF